MGQWSRLCDHLLASRHRSSRQPQSGMEGMVVGFWGGARGEPAAVELRSRLGNIRLSLAE